MISESLNAGLLLDPLDLNTELFIPVNSKDFINKAVELKLLTRLDLILELPLKIARRYIQERGSFKGSITSEIKVNNLAKFLYIALGITVIVSHLIAYA